MRLDILNHGYRPATRALFTLIRVFSGRPLPDAAKLTFYRPDFYGARAKRFTHAAMRGPSAWSVADRELMAAYVATINESSFCIGAHTATAAQAYGDGAIVDTALSDLDSAPIADGLRATLRMLGKLTRDPNAVTPADMRAVLASGVTPEQIRDALAVCAAFDTTARLADAFAFDLLTSEGYAAGAKFLLARGYR
ncbi:carboxymuconolactone decarboxylase family protein [Nocardia sp. NPDC127579]|uniref:carboxymuconolactone decarboxylase family protein n=1 Tax=Nocardia sp. NPDC127579 TaxID=3345402 RepID=UPI00362DFFFD